MPKSIRLLVTALAAASMAASAQEAGPAQQAFTPRSVPARVVIVISGQSGMPAYQPAARQIADAGFQVVLVDGNDFWIKDTRRAWEMLRGVITRAQAGPNALPGKVGVVGYSLGGATTLTYAARMPDLVATAVATYPLTSFIKDPADFVGKIKVPVQVFAGTTDTYNNCCLIDTARQLAAAAQAQPSPTLALHEYNGVGHGFNLPTAAAKDVAAGQDAMARTVAILKQALPAAGAR